MDGNLQENSDFFHQEGYTSFLAIVKVQLHGPNGSTVTLFPGIRPGNYKHYPLTFHRRLSTAIILRI